MSTYRLNGKTVTLEEFLAKKGEPGIPMTPSSAWPLQSAAAGCHPDQVDQMTQDSHAKGVPTDFDPKTGNAIFTDRSHRAKYLKAYSMHDRDGGYAET